MQFFFFSLGAVEANCRRWQVNECRTLASDKQNIVCEIWRTALNGRDFTFNILSTQKKSHKLLVWHRKCMRCVPYARSRPTTIIWDRPNARMIQQYLWANCPMNINLLCSCFSSVSQVPLVTHILLTFSLVLENNEKVQIVGWRRQPFRCP